MTPHIPDPLTPHPFDVFVFPIIDWDFRFQRPQHLATQFALRGHRVFYFDTDFLPDDCVFEPSPIPVAPNVWRWKLPGSLRPPNIFASLPTEGQLTAMLLGLRRLREVFEVGTTLCIVDYPFWWPLVQRLSNCVTVYDCMDDYTSFRQAGPPAFELEPLILRGADLVVCSSVHLQDRARNLGAPNPHLVRNAVDPEHYRIPPPQLAIEPDGRTIGCHGAISDWTDLELIAYAAQSLPTHRFVLVGGSDVDMSALERLPNVVLTGEVPYSQLPAYLHAFDIGILPYRICDYALASDPMKVWEYLSAGKPVVSVRFPEVERYSGIIELASTREEFVAAIRKALDGRSAEKSGQLATYVLPHTWGARCGEIQELARPFYPKVSVVVLCHNSLEFTRSSLESIRRFSRYPNLELVIVDNGSTDDTPLFLEAWRDSGAHATFLRSNTNLGFAAGNNLGLRAATGDYLVILNNDVFVTEGWIAGLLAHFRTNPKLGLLGPVTNASGNESVIDIEYADMEEMAVRAAAYTSQHRGERTHPAVLHFFCVMMPREVWRTVGELDEGFGLGMFEDDDYTMRVRKAGYETACAEDVFVHHHHGASFGELAAAVREELFTRNRGYYESKWGPWTAPVFREEVRARNYQQ